MLEVSTAATIFSGTHTYEQMVNLSIIRSRTNILSCEFKIQSANVRTASYLNLHINKIKSLKLAVFVFLSCVSLKHVVLYVFSAVWFTMCQELYVVLSSCKTNSAGVSKEVRPCAKKLCAVHLLRLCNNNGLLLQCW